MTEDEPNTVDLEDAIGVDSGISTQCFSIYVPDKDRLGNETGNQRKWILEPIDLFGEINGGATAMAPCEGTWRDEDGEVIREHPAVVYSYIVPDAFLANLPRIREFLHRMGRGTNQGEIAFEFDGRFYRIRSFDEGNEQHG